MSRLRKRRATEHEYVEEQLSAYLDGELRRSEREVVEQHLAKCPACRWSLNTLRQTVQWTSQLPTVRVPRTFTIPVPARPVRAARRWTFVPVLQGATALVALLLVLAIAGEAMLTGWQPARTSRPEPQTLAVEATRIVEVVKQVVVETVVVEREVEAPMMQAAPTGEAAVAEEAPVEEPAAEAPAEPATVIAEAALTATMAPAGAGEGLQDAREGTSAAPEGDTPTPAPEPTVALAVPAAPPMPTATAMAAPKLEPAATQVAMPPPSSQVEAGEALSGPRDVSESERSVGTRPATLIWVRWGEYVLGVLLIVLVGATLGAMIWRRSGQ